MGTGFRRRALDAAPLAGATALAVATTPIGTHVDQAQYALAGALFLVALALALTPPAIFAQRRLGASIAYLAAAGLLRKRSAGGINAGTDAIALIPIVYTALNGGARDLGLITAGVAAYCLAPIFLVGPPGYPHSQYRAALVMVAISAIIGLTVQRLVARVRQEARDAREREGTLREISAFARTLLRSASEVRRDICEAAQRIGGADVAILYEAAANGALFQSAAAGLTTQPEDDPRTSSAIGEAFLAGESILLAEELPGHLGGDNFWDAIGRPATVLLEPLLRGSEPVGVLAVGWQEPVPASGLTVAVMSLLAHEAASVIDHADTLSELASIADTDALTGLPNRRAWDARVRHAATDGRALTIASLDLDNFKLYNDTQGHPGGDRLLKETAAAWREQLRDGDFLARVGGDEFALLLADCTAGGALEVIERLHGSVAGEQTCSIGVASATGGEPSSQLLAHADALLYEAKVAGRNCIRAAGASGWSLPL